mmetsp:Transcript_40554/g.84860  ORF Transcript_40554/g.84860 Transcript_40554/m.84860 type:complete len:781 (+) Transcript_40554:105-2447(+)
MTKKQLPITDQGDRRFRSLHQPWRKKKDSPLFRLTTEQAKRTSFPEGCPVIYNFQRRDNRAGASSSSSSSSNNAVLEAREGIIQSIFLNKDKRRFEFQIERWDSTESESLPFFDTALEDDIAYAIHCPVLVNRSAKLGGSGEEIEAKVMFAKPVNKNGEIIMSYIVQYSSIQENQLIMEEGVTADRISYHLNMVDMNEKHIIGYNAGEEEPRIPFEQSSVEGASQKEAVENNDSRPIIEGTHNSQSPSVCAEEQTENQKISLMKDQPIKNTTKDEDHSLSPNSNTMPQTYVFVEKPIWPSKHSTDFDSSLTNDFSYDIYGKIFEPPDNTSSPKSNTMSKDNQSSDNKIKKFEHSELTSTNSILHRYSGDRSRILSNSDPGFRSDRREEAYELSRKVKKPDVSECTKCSKTGEELKCQLTVPLWVLDSQEDLFVNLVGLERSGKRPCKQKRIYANTDCNPSIPGYSSGDAMKPMKITITPHRKYHGPDPCIILGKAISMVEEYIQDYTQENSSNGSNARLYFELRLGSRPSPLLPWLESGAIQTSNNLWVQLLELPCVTHGWTTNSVRRVQLIASLISRRDHQGIHESSSDALIAIGIDKKESDGSDTTSMCKHCISGLEVKKEIQRHSKSSSKNTALDSKNCTYLPRLDLGDTGTTRDMMMSESSKRTALEKLNSLKIHDFAFILRSDGQWTYAIIADKQDDRILFVVDADGQTKKLCKKYWSNSIRLVNPREARFNSTGENTKKQTKKGRNSKRKRSKPKNDGKLQRHQSMHGILRKSV